MRDCECNDCQCEYACECGCCCECECEACACVVICECECCEDIEQKGKKMSVYSISSINVKDWDAYAEYMKLVPAVIKKYGGKYLVDFPLRTSSNEKSLSSNSLS